MSTYIVILVFIISLIIVGLGVYIIRHKPYSVYLGFGLSNRLRTALGLRRKHGKINVYWPIDNDCNGHFLEAYEPLDGINFVSKVAISPPNFVGEKTYNSLLGDDYDRKTEYADYAQLTLRPEVRSKVDTFVKKHHISEGVAIHVRNTDFRCPDEYKVTNERFYNFIDKHPNVPVFLATDNAETQKLYMSKYPNIVVYKNIEKNDHLRQTSFIDAIIDVYIASQTSEFLGTPYSSYSELIETLRVQ